MNKLTVAPDRLERIRKLCLALPNATEKVAWGDPTWRVKDKIFAMQKGNYEGGRPSLWVKGLGDAQAILVEADPDTYFVPGYVGNKGWVGIHLDGKKLDWKMLTKLINDSYEQIASPKKRKRSS